MKRYLRSLALFLLPLVVALFALEVLLRRIPNDYSYQHHYLQAHGADVKILVLGNSHAYRDVDPSLLPCRSFSAANIAQGYVHDEALLEEHLAQLPNLQWLILPASYGSLRMDPTRGKQSWRAKNYVIYHGLLQFITEPRSVLEVINHPLLEELHMAKDYLFHRRDNRVCNDLGAGLNEQPKARDFNLSVKRAVKRHTVESTAQVPINRAALEHIIQLAQAHHVQVLLFTPPTSQEYCDAIAPAQLEELTSTMTELSVRFPNVTYANFFTETGFGHDDLLDGDHLNAQGAAKLTHLLAERLKCQ